MANRSLTTIKIALASVLSSMTVEGGYSMTIPADHVYRVFSQETVNDKTDASYPKFFLLVDSGSGAKEPSGRVLRKIQLWVVAIVKQLDANGIAPNLMIEAFADDLETLLMANDTLNGTVEDVTLSEYLIGSGELAPEGAGIFKLTIEYFKQF